MAVDYSNTTATVDLSGYRPAIDASFVATTVYVDDTLGDDVLGDGTSGAPYATIAKAISTIPIGVTQQVVVQLIGAGPYTLPTSINQWNNITLRGQETIDDTRTISSVSSTSTTNGIVFTLGGAALTLNQLKGRHLQITGVLSGSRNIIVGYNNTSNVCSGVMYNRTFLSDVQSSPAGGSADIISYTQVQLSANTVITASVNLNFELIRLTGSFTLFANATEKLNAWKCQFENTGLIAGRAGGIYALSSTIATIGSSTNGLFAIRNGGDFRIGFATLVTDTNAGANNAFVSGSSAGIFTTEGGCVFSNLDAKGIELDNINMFSISQANLKMLFETWSGAASCAAGFRINTLGGAGLNYSIAQANGGVLSNYFVTAQNNAFVELASSTSVTTATVTNAVSADNGTTAVALVADGTRIEGGSPSLTGVLIPQEEFDVAHNASAAANNNQFVIGNSAYSNALSNLSYDGETPPIAGNDLGSLILLGGAPYLSGDLVIYEENTPPATALPLYARITMGHSQAGVGIQCVTFYADIESVSPGTAVKHFEDEYGRKYPVFNHADPATDVQLSAVYVNPAASAGEELGLAYATNGSCYAFSTDDNSGGFLKIQSNNNSFAVLFDVSAADPKIALYYDNAGSGVDVTVSSGGFNNGSSSLALGPAYTPIYFDEDQADPSLRLYHRSPFITQTISVPIPGAPNLLLDVQYDGTGTLGVPVYINTGGFPATFEAVNPSATSSTFKTSSSRKGYQSNDE